MKLMRYHFQRFFLQKKVVYTMCFLIVLGTMVNVIPFIMNSNVSSVGGIYNTSFYLADYYMPIIVVLSFLFPLFVYYLVVDDSYNESFMEHMLFSRVDKKKFYWSKMVFIFIASFLLLMCFFFTTALTSKIFYNTSLLDGTYLSNGSNIGKYQFINSEYMKNYYHFPSLLFNHGDLYCLIKSLLFSLIGSSLGVMSFGIMQWTNRYILNYILPVGIVFIVNLAFHFIKLPYDLSSLLSANVYVSSHYLGACIFWMIVPIILGIILVYLHLRED